MYLLIMTISMYLTCNDVAMYGKLYCIVATVTFEQAAYNVSENNTTQLIVLILSKPSSTIISLEVFDVNTTAFGEMQL